MPTKKKKVSPKNPKSQNLVLYVQNNEPSIKLFSDPKKAMKFVDKFTKDNPDPQDGYWIDFVITDIRGEIVMMDQTGIEIDEQP